MIPLLRPYNVRILSIELGIWRRTMKILSLAAAAKSLQSFLTLCDPIDGSPPGSPVPGILQERTLEWVAISFSNAWKWKNKVKSLSHVQFLATPWTAAHQAPPSMGFSRQEYWSGVLLPSPILSFSLRSLLFQIIQEEELTMYPVKERRQWYSTSLESSPLCLCTCTHTHTHTHTYFPTWDLSVQWLYNTHFGSGTFQAISRSRLQGKDQKRQLIWKRDMVLLAGLGFMEQNHFMIQISMKWAVGIHSPFNLSFVIHSINDCWVCTMCSGVEKPQERKERCNLWGK